jgi:hypothetical protein
MAHKYKCPKCGGNIPYFQPVQGGYKVTDFNPTDSVIVSGDPIPDIFQTPGVQYVQSISENVAFCQACPVQVRMDILKPPKPPKTPLSRNALVALACACFPIWFIIPGLSIYFGFRAIKEIKASDIPLGGKKLAILAIVLGFIEIVPWIANVSALISGS